MSFYGDMAAIALELLTEFGAQMTITRSSGGQIHPVTGEVIPATVTSLTTTGALTRYADKMIDGARVLSSDRLLVLSNQQKPMPSDKFTIGGQQWSIANNDNAIDTVIPDGVTAVRYLVQVRL